MKHLLLPTALLLGFSLNAQYYYKDIVGTKESSDLIKTYQKTGVSRVNVASYDADNTRNNDFFISQIFSKPHITLRTTTHDGDNPESVLTSIADDMGQVLKTVDSSANFVSTTDYSYDNTGRLLSMKNTSTDSAKSLTQTEVHQWNYQNGLPVRMVRIVNARDTTYVDFKIDGGNVVEENASRRGVSEEPVYYYYNNQNRLTDIVRYNKKAKRLLPEYMFEYASDGKVIQKITVPANSSEYLIWRYQYDSDGLKTKEAIYDRNKQLNGRVEYQYSRGD